MNSSILDKNFFRILQFDVVLAAELARLRTLQLKLREVVRIDLSGSQNLEIKIYQPPLNGKDNIITSAVCEAFQSSILIVIVYSYKFL